MSDPSKAGSTTTRRGFLKRGLLGGALLALGGSGFLALRGTRSVPLPKEPLKVLDGVEYAIVHALAARIITQREGMPSLEEVQAAYNVDVILVQAGEDVRAEVKQLLRLFENGLAGFLFGGRTQPFTQLSGEEQDEVLREWRDSRITLRRTGYQALLTLVLAAYYASPKVWPAVGYPGPPEGFHQPDAPVWKGGGAPRPEGNGVYHQEVREGAQ